ncbi:MAG: hypothetical protein ACRCWQ_11170 [Bacilli bacterium]
MKKQSFQFICGYLGYNGVIKLKGSEILSRFDFDRCFKTFSDAYFLDWLSLASHHFTENYSTAPLEEMHIERLKLGEELLADASFSNTRIIDRLYLLKNKKNEKDKMIIHIEFESAISHLDVLKWREYFCRIQGNITNLPIYHILVLAPGCSGIPEISWQQYLNSLEQPNETNFYFPLYMDNYEEGDLTPEMAALWRAVNWAHCNKSSEVLLPMDVYKNVLQSILSVYNDMPLFREIKPLVSALSYLFKIPLTMFDAFFDSFVISAGGQKIDMYDLIRGEEREQMLKEMRAELYPMIKAELEAVYLPLIEELRLENEALRKENDLLRDRIQKLEEKG